MTLRPASGIAPASAIPRKATRSNVPVARWSRTMPMRRPTSPAFVVQNALSAARAASGLRYQNPISRYEQTPTSSQHMKS